MAEEREAGGTGTLIPGLGGSTPAPAKKGTGGTRTQNARPAAAPAGGSTGNLGLGSAATGGGYSATLGGDPWQQGEVTTSNKESQPINLVGPEGDTLGIHALYPKGSIKGGTYEAYVAGVAQMSVANRQNMADVLVNAGILAPHTTGKPYTTSEVQSALGAALSQTMENESNTSGPKVKGVATPGAIPSLTSYLSDQIAQNSGSTSSAATTTANDNAALQNSLNDSFSKIATAYGIPVSDAAVAAHAQAAVASGLDSTQADANFTEYAKQVATGLYPSLAPQIAGGVDVATLLDPYKQLIQKTLGIDPATIDFTNPQYAKFLNGNIDPSTNRAAPMTLSQVSQTLMQDPSYGYQNTQEAKNTASSLTASILKTFGAIGNDNISLSMSGPTPDLSST